VQNLHAQCKSRLAKELPVRRTAPVALLAVIVWFTSRRAP
jgi:hypothetical protein